mgnify:CR=1 FL=1
MQLQAVYADENLSMDLTNRFCKIFDGSVQYSNVAHR